MLKERIRVLAKEKGVGLPAIEKSIPSADKLKMVADYFGVTVDYLLGDADEREASGTPFAERLKASRETRGMSAPDVAGAIGVSPSVFSGWERGAGAPQLASLARLCSLLSVSADYLLGLTDDPQRGIIKSPAELADDGVVAVQKTNADALTIDEIAAIRAMLGKERA